MIVKLLIGVFIMATTTEAIVEPVVSQAEIFCLITKCPELDYCNKYDGQCKPCSFICNSTTHNYDENICFQHCQKYLHQHQDLKDHVHSLTILVYSLVSLTILLILVIVFLTVKPYFKLKKIRETIVKVFGKRWIKKKKSVNKVNNNGESRTIEPQQNPIQITMPTITATIVSSTQDANGTQNTSSTTIDTTLDFAYDNPAMTPSPESTTAIQTKSKRESSF